LAAGALVELTEPDQRLIIEMSGGGGWGDPAQRDPNQIRQDRQEGLVTSALEGFPN
jgi:N-methylhydantoinase B/oxoprolinase/acetone carboxylase alpha subunit